jgi:hypothetical protein
VQGKHSAMFLRDQFFASNETETALVCIEIAALEAEDDQELGAATERSARRRSHA